MQLITATNTCWYSSDLIYIQTRWQPMGTLSHKDVARSILASLIGAKSHQEIQIQKAHKWSIISSAAGQHSSTDRWEIKQASNFLDAD